MGKRHTYEYIKNFFEEKGYILLSTTYENNSSKLEYKCPKGHIGKITFHSFETGSKCPICDKENKRIPFDKVRSFIENLGYEWLNSENRSYVSRDKIKYKCRKCGKKVEVTLGNLLCGYRCRVCSHNKERKKYEDVKKEFEEKNYKLLSTEYTNNKQKLKYICSKGHINEIYLSNFYQECGCKKCDIEKRKTPFEFIKNYFEKNGYYLVSTFYVPNEKLECVCPKRHKWFVKWADFYHGEVRCRRCFGKHSKSEKEIADYVKFLGFEILENDRSLIKPLELDIYVPAKKVAIEYCGLFRHSEVGGNKDRVYHRRKLYLCNEQDIRLIMIFEDEYLNRKEAVLSRIRNALGIIDRKIYARNCEVREIDKHVSATFVSENHLQGSTPAKVHFGLFYKDELVAVMSFGHNARAHTRKAKTIELKRMCTKAGTAVVGGFSKLFKQAIAYCKANGYDRVVSYCDMRWAALEPVYEKMGFKLLRESKYTPHYVTDKYRVRVRNQTLSIKPEERGLGKTEWELRKEQGYDRIWDCGHRTYEFLIKD